MINSTGEDYRYFIGDRLGRTRSKEQYAFLYRSSVLEPMEGSVYNIEDRQDLLHREPMVGTFRVRETTRGEPFTFTVLNMHTDPDEAGWEVRQLADVMRFVASYRPQEDDVILLGDLNVDIVKLNEALRLPQYRSVIGDLPTNTRGTKQYDHIVIDPQASSEFTGVAGVFNFQKYFRLNQEQALDISDHLPVWAEFSTTEQYHPTQLASPNTGTVR